MSWNDLQRKSHNFDFTWTHMSLSLGACQRRFSWPLFHRIVGFSRKSPQSSMDLHGNEWYWRARANHDATTGENEKIKKRKRFITGTRCTLVFQVFFCHRKTNVVKLELNRSRSWLSYLGLLFHHFRFIFNFCFRPDMKKAVNGVRRRRLIYFWTNSLSLYHQLYHAWQC